MKNKKSIEKSNEKDWSYEEVNETTTLVQNKKTGRRIQVVGFTQEVIRNIFAVKKEMYAKMGIK